MWFNDEISDNTKSRSDERKSRRVDLLSRFFLRQYVVKGLKSITFMLFTQLLSSALFKSIDFLSMFCFGHSRLRSFAIFTICQFSRLFSTKSFFFFFCFMTTRDDNLKIPSRDSISTRHDSASVWCNREL